jgi:predicted anti-sigma-YlaC factor YlaD
MDLMTIKSFRKWIHLVFGTQEEETDCEAFARAVPQYVDLQVAGESADVQFPKVKHHLTQCSECCDLYHTLYDMALMESHELTRAERVESEHREVASEQVTLEPS